MHLSSKELKTTEINSKNFKKLWNINIVAFELAILQLHIKIIILIAIIELLFWYGVGEVLSRFSQLGS